MLIVLIALYILFTTLIMFNTLVAAMNTTYESTKDNAESRWRLERVRIIASIESEMNVAADEQVTTVGSVAIVGSDRAREERRCG